MDTGDSRRAPRRPTPREHAHFAAVARAMAEEKRLQIQRSAHAETADGILVGLQLAALFPPTGEFRALEERRAAEQVGLRRRALALRWASRTGRTG